MHKIGVLGGTFDPVHIGHLILAEQAVATFGLSKVLFVPSGRPPHKDVSKITPLPHRLEMLRLAIEGNDMFEISEIECSGAEINYTYITLEKLNGIYGCETELYYIIGADVLHYITKFKNFTRVFASCAIIASTRPGEYMKRIEHIAGELVRMYNARILLMKFPEIAISSSMIRDKIAGGESARYMLPDPVPGYIAKNGLYDNIEDTAIPGYWESIPDPAIINSKKQPCNASCQPCGPLDAAALACGGHSGIELRRGLDNSQGVAAIKRLMSERLGKSRYRHTIGVMEAAVGLAGSLGADRDMAAIAALLHDCMREAPLDEQIAACESGGILITDHELNAPLVIHAPAGSVEARRLVSSDNAAMADITEAVAFHTTGCEGMGLLAKIIFVADAIEPGREYEAARKARAILGRGEIGMELLDAAVLYLLEEQIEHIGSSGRALHPDTVMARDWLAKSAEAARSRYINN